MTLDQLDENALVQILTEPKNALCKQYEKLLDMDGIQLEFEPDALPARLRSRRFPASAVRVVCVRSLRV